MNEKERIQKAYEDSILNEADNALMGELKEYVDNVVRYVIGDQKVALSKLNRMKFNVDMSHLDYTKYNDIYGKLYDQIYKAFRTAIIKM